MNRPQGLSLVELVVSLSLVAMISGSTMATLSGGLAVWDRIQQHGVQQQWFQVAFEGLRRDLRSMRRFEPIGFTGDYDAVSFPAVLGAGGALTATEGNELGCVAYFFDSGRQRLCRSRIPYRRFASTRIKSACEPMLEGIRSIRFSYYVQEEHGSSFRWTGRAEGPEPPLAVKMEIRYDTTQASSSFTTATTTSLMVPIPIAAVETPP